MKSIIVDNLVIEEKVILEKLKINEGESATFSCPRPDTGSLVWRRQGQEVSVKGQVVIQSGKLEDAGIYTCYHGNKKVNSVELIVTPRGK